MEQLGGKSPFSLTKLAALDKNLLAFKKAQEIAGPGSLFCTSEVNDKLFLLLLTAKQPLTTPSRSLSFAGASAYQSPKMHLPGYSLELQFSRCSSGHQSFRFKKWFEMEGTLRII